MSSKKPETPEEMYEVLQAATDCHSLVRKHFTKEVIKHLKDTKSKLGTTLADCVRSGAWNLESHVGAYAGDPESYTIFAELLDPIIKDYHKIPLDQEIVHPDTDFGDVDNLGFGDLDPEGKLIVSTRVRTGRCHAGFGFPLVLKKEERLKMVAMTVKVLNQLTGEYKGTYYPLSEMSDETHEKLIRDHYLFKNVDSMRNCVGAGNDWPSGRGIFFNEKKTFLVWQNETDHMRMISMQDGGDLAAVYKRWVNGVKFISERLDFARDKRLGFLTFCPSNLGTAMRCSVHIRIPLLAAEPDFKQFCESLKLQPRGIDGEHSASKGGIYDISNKRRLGISEINAIKEMVTGVKEIIRREKELQAKQK